MKKSKIITFEGQDVTCKELTVAEIDAYLNSPSQALHTLDMVFHDRLPLAVVTQSTGLKAEALQGLAPSALTVLWDAVEDVNPFFLATLKRLAGLGRAAMDNKTT